MRQLKGTSLYCGIGYGIEEMKAHLEQAAGLGINAVFTSLQLPESNKAVLLRDFPKMTELAHSYGMIVEADVGARTADLFGLDINDISVYRKMGVDYARLDYGFSVEMTVAASNNPDGVVVVLNASTVTDEELQTLIRMGLNKEQTTFNYNYYPMRYTGMTVPNLIRQSDLIHKYGFRVGGFVPGKSHCRMACSIGLPTLERHRNMDTFAVIQEAYLLGMDDIFFGDDFANETELKILAEADPDVLTLRMKPCCGDDISSWLLNRTLQPMQDVLEMIVRSNAIGSRQDSAYPGNPDNTPSLIRRKGDVTIGKTHLYRYTGEIQIVRKDLEMDPDIGWLGRIIDEDLPILDILYKTKPFRFINK